MRSKTSRQIILTLLMCSYSSQIDMINIAKKFKNHPICTSFKKHRTTIGFHLQKLVNERIIDYVKIGNETKYFLKDESYISDILIIHKKSLLDDISPYYLERLEELHEDAWDQVFKVIWDIFPTPFRC
jgi:hypothetical protein